jgi:hypothetical protein
MRRFALIAPAPPGDEWRRNLDHVAEAAGRNDELPRSRAGEVVQGTIRRRLYEGD